MKRNKLLENIVNGRKITRQLIVDEILPHQVYNRVNHDVVILGLNYEGFEAFEEKVKMYFVNILEQERISQNNRAKRKHRNMRLRFKRIRN